MCQNARHSDLAATSLLPEVMYASDELDENRFTGYVTVFEFLCVSEALVGPLAKQHSRKTAPEPACSRGVA